MITFDLSLTIARPLPAVFAWWSDPANLAAWQSGVVRVDLPEGPLRVGSRWTVHRKALGMTQAMASELIAFEAEKRVVERSQGGPAKNTTTTTFTDLGGSTRMDTHVEVDLGGVLGRFGDKLAGGKIKDQAAGDQKNLKQVLERVLAVT